MPVTDIIPRSLRSAARAAQHRLAVAAGLRDPLVPPPWIQSMGGFLDFEEVGNECFGYLRKYCGLRRDHAVLDIGCGIGRLARPLVPYLTSGTYHGLDIMKPSIEWCQKVYAPHRNFTFEWLDIYNKQYNPDGRARAHEYRLPFDAGSLDVVLLHSVFTHMLPRDVDHYIGEISRVLRPGGRCLITWFVVSPGVWRLIRDGSAQWKFETALPDGCLVEFPDVPEKVVGYEEDSIRGMYTKHGLSVEPILWGKWSGRPHEECVSWQDIVIAQKA